jgi:hypothetical protein
VHALGCVAVPGGGGPGAGLDGELLLPVLFLSRERERGLVKLKSHQAWSTNRPFLFVSIKQKVNK